MCTSRKVYYLVSFRRSVIDLETKIHVCHEIIYNILYKNAINFSLYHTTVIDSDRIILGTFPSRSRPSLSTRLLIKEHLPIRVRSYHDIFAIISFVIMGKKNNFRNGVLYRNSLQNYRVLLCAVQIKTEK